ncbi:unnamed protein product [Mytilus edulis]|uniref:Uncharacterized protein n=1 Tax=Mytilus edulis TaxID=6550 RepID=A0A8S3R5C1_MYTED|nr:unnamed protein product [Mytilus edulis]
MTHCESVHQVFFCTVILRWLSINAKHLIPMMTARSSNFATDSSEMPSKVPKRSNRKRKITQRLGEVMENIGSSDLGKGVPIDNPVPSSSNPNNNSGQLSADNPHVQSNPIDPNTTGVIQGRDVISPDPTLIPTHQGVNSICPPRQDTSRCNTTEMTTPSQSHSTNIIDNQSFESSHPSCSNVISRSGQQCVMPTEGSPSQQVVNHLLQGTPNIDTFSNELGAQGLSRSLALVFVMISTMNQAAQQEFVDMSTLSRFVVETTAGGIANNPNMRTPILTPPLEKFQINCNVKNVDLCPVHAVWEYC